MRVTKLMNLGKAVFGDESGDVRTVRCHFAHVKQGVNNCTIVSLYRLYDGEPSHTTQVDVRLLVRATIGERVEVIDALAGDGRNWGRNWLLAGRGIYIRFEPPRDQAIWVDRHDESDDRVHAAYQRKHELWRALRINSDLLDATPPQFPPKSRRIRERTVEALSNEIHKADLAALDAELARGERG